MQKIFTTHDGVDIYPGTAYYSLNPLPHMGRRGIIPANTIVGPYINPEAHNQSGDIIYFSTREAAEAYAQENKSTTNTLK